MSRRNRSLATLVVVLLAWTAAAQPPVVVVVSSELPPYVSESPGQSFLSSLLPEIGKLMGVHFEIRFMPWKRCEAAVEQGEAWAAMPYVITVERQQHFAFSAPLYHKRTVFFQYLDEGEQPIRYRKLADLRPYRVGVVNGYYYVPMLEQAGVPIDLAGSEVQNLRKLRSGRVDLAPAVDVVGWYLIRQLFARADEARFLVLDPPLQVGSNHMMVARDSPESLALLQRFDAALDSLRRKGIYQALASRHGLAGLD